MIKVLCSALSAPLHQLHLEDNDVTNDNPEVNQAIKYIMGIALMFIGAYMLLSHIQLTGFQSMGFRSSLYSFSAGRYPLSVTTGTIFIPFILGVIWLFYDSSKLWGWLIAGISIVALILGVIMKMKLTMSSVSAFDASTMLVLMFGGFGMFLSAHKKTKNDKKESGDKAKNPKSHS